MPEASVPRHISAAVVFSTRFGNTEKIAKWFESGLKQAGVQTVCENAQVVSPESLKGYDLICIGGPTEEFSASKPMKEFLRSTSVVDLGGKLAFAFDTKLDSPLSGSAARYIEHALDDQGLHVVVSRESAIVTTRRQRGAITGADLKAGEEERFEQLGVRVANAAANAIGQLSLHP